MRRLKQTLLALTICTLVISCSLTTSSTIMKVQRGMSQEEVLLCIYNHRTTKTNQKYPSVNL